MGCPPFSSAVEPDQIGEPQQGSLAAASGPASALYLRRRMEKVVVKKQQITSVTSLGGGYTRREGACHHQDPQKPWTVATACLRRMMIQKKR